MKQTLMAAILSLSGLAIVPAIFSDASATESLQKPQCLFAGTENEGWYDNNRKLIRLVSCHGMNLDCMYERTRSEGWYSYSLGNRQLFKLEECANKEPPSCGILPLGVPCENRLILCEEIGTPNEGWYMYLKEEIELIQWARCGHHGQESKIFIE